MPNIIKGFPVVNQAIIDKFREQSTATVHEVMGKSGAMTSDIKPILPGVKICGQALTVKGGSGDNLMLIKAVNMARRGQIIVLDNGKIQDSGPFGEILAVECVSKGVEALITSGSIRDSYQVKELNFPVFCTGFSIIGTTKSALGLINHPISCGGVIINPGDIVLGDDDGIVVIPLKEAEEVLLNAIKKDEEEAKIMEQIKEGKSLFDLYGYQKIMDKLGCIEE